LSRFLRLTLTQVRRLVPTLPMASTLRTTRGGFPPPRRNQAPDNSNSDRDPPETATQVGSTSSIPIVDNNRNAVPPLEQTNPLSQRQTFEIGQSSAPTLPTSEDTALLNRLTAVEDELDRFIRQQVTRNTDTSMSLQEFAQQQNEILRLLDRHLLKPPQ
jgi:hypothetical protein